MTFKSRRTRCELFVTYAQLCVAGAGGFHGSAKRRDRGCPHMGRGPWHEDGQAALEMIVTLTVAFSLVFWLFELCMFTYTCTVLNDATQEGVRYAIMHGTDSSNCSGPDAQCTNQTPYSNVQAVVTSAASASLHNMSAMTVTVSYANNTAALGNPVAVKVAYTYVPYVTLPGLVNTVTFASQGDIVF